MATVNINDWDKKNTATTQDLSDTTSVSNLQLVKPVKISFNSTSSSGTGDAVFTTDIADDPTEIVVTESDETTTRAYEIENIDTTNDEAWIWVYGPWNSNSTEMVIGLGTGDGTDYSISNSFSNETDNLQTFFFNESSLPAVDHSGNGFDGTGDLAPTTGISGQFSDAYRFDAVDDQVEATNLNNFNPTTSEILTHNIWVKTTDTGNNWLYGRRDSDDSNRIDIKLNQDNTDANEGFIQIRLHDSSGATTLEAATSSSTNINDGNWHMLTAVFDYSGDAKLYIDANSQSLNFENKKQTSQDAWQQEQGIGAFNLEDGTNTGYLDADVDQFQIYQRELSSNEIQAKYDSSPAGGQTFFSWSGEQDTAITQNLQGAADLAVDTAGTITNIIGLSGDSTLTLNGSGTLTTILRQRISGDANLALNSTGDLSKILNISGDATTSLNGSGLLSEGNFVQIVGEADLSLNSTGTLTKIQSMVGNATNTLSTSGDASLINRLSADTSFSLNTDGRIARAIGIVGNADLSLDASATLVDRLEGFQLFITNEAKTRFKIDNEAN